MSSICAGVDARCASGRHMFYDNKGLRLCNTNMVLEDPLSGIKSYCSGAISYNVLSRTLFITTRRINFVMWLIRLKVRCFSHFVVPRIFGKVMIIDLFGSSEE